MYFTFNEYFVTMSRLEKVKKFFFETTCYNQSFYFAKLMCDTLVSTKNDKKNWKYNKGLQLHKYERKLNVFLFFWLLEEQYVLIFTFFLIFW